MSQETPYSTSPHSGDDQPQQRGQFFSHRGRARGYGPDGRGNGYGPNGRGRGYGPDGRSRGYHPDRGTGYHRDVYYRRGGGFHQENRGRGLQGDPRGGGFQENRGRGFQGDLRGGYHAEHRGRGYHPEGRGRGYRQQDSHGGYYQDSNVKPVNPQETLECLGVTDLRQHLEQMRFEGQISNNPPSTYSDEPSRSQHSPRGGTRSRGRSGSRGRGRSEDRGLLHHQHPDEGLQPEIYINDVYNIKVEMSTSTGQKTYQLVREDRLSNLKHVPDYEEEGDWSPPTRSHHDFQRGQGANRRGPPGRGRGRGRGRGGHVARRDDWHANSGSEDVNRDSRSDRGRGRGNRHRTNYESGTENKHSQESKVPDEIPRTAPEPVVESEETWDLEIAKYEAALKSKAQQSAETVASQADHDDSENLQHKEDVSGEDCPEVNSEDFTENQNVPDEYYPEEGEYYEDGEQYEYEGNDEYGTVYAEECENYLEENADAVEGYDNEFHSDAYQEDDNVRAIEVQNVDQNNRATPQNDPNSERTRDLTENGANGVAAQDNVKLQNEGRCEVNKSSSEQADKLVENKACLDTQQTKTPKDDSQPVLSRSGIEESSADCMQKDTAPAKESKNAKDKKKKVRINAP